MNFQFDDISIDVGKRQVFRGEERLDVSGLTFDLLLAIVEAAPNIVSADELAEKVWSGRPVTPETLTQRTMMLRQALGDDADNPRYVEVVRGHGLRLIPKVGSASAANVSMPSIPWKKIATPAAFALIGAAIVYLGFGAFNTDENSAPPAEIRRFALDLGDLQGIGQSGVQAEIALSPDGNRIAYIANFEGGTNQLYVRMLDQFEATAVPGTEGARHPFFSPDGEWIGFDLVGNNAVRKVSIRGGPVHTITEDTQRMYGASWSNDGKIIYSTASLTDVFGGTLMEVSAEGGVAEALLTPELGTAFTWPHHLPDGDSVLFTIRKADGLASDGSVALFSLESGKHRSIIAGAFNAKYSPTGHIVFARRGSLWAVPFDLDRLQITGQEQPLVEGVQVNNRLGGAIYDFSDGGLLVYLRGEEVSNNLSSDLSIPLWVGRDGKEVSIDAEPRNYTDPSLAPDGQKLAVRVIDEAGANIWVLEIERGKLTRLTFNAAVELDPHWSPDGTRIFFASARAGGAIFSKSADGTGLAQPITESRIAPRIDTISPDGSHLLLLDRLGNESDVFSMSTTGESFPQPLLATQFDEDNVEISPDGQFIAYESDESTREEIYVRTYPDMDGGKWQISTDGGRQPIWGPNGSELFFRDATTGWISVVNIRTAPVFSYGDPQVLIRGDYDVGNGTSYDISPDGQRFLVFRELDQPGSTDEEIASRAKLAIVENWFEELKRIAPTDVSN